MSIWCHKSNWSAENCFMRSFLTSGLSWNNSNNLKLEEENSKLDDFSDIKGKTKIGLLFYFFLLS